MTGSPRGVQLIWGLAILVLLSAGLPPAISTSDQPLLAGAARRSIVPPFPTRMGGFFDRTATFDDVANPIYSRALVFENGGVRIAVVNVDLVGVSRELVEAARETIQRETGIPSENVLVAATHNHSGPAGYQKRFLFGAPFDPRLFDFLRDEIAQTAIDAYQNREPAYIGFKWGELKGVTRNRQQGNDLAVDADVGVLKVRKTDSRDLIGILFNFTGHPVILGANNLSISGEFPGQAQQTVEEVLGGVALFTQGACRDVTAQRSGPPNLEVQRLGRILAAEVIKTAELIQATTDSRLVSQLQEVELGLRDIPSVEKAKELLSESESKLKESEGSSASDIILHRLRREHDSRQMTLRMARFLEAAPEGFADASKGQVHLLQIGPLLMVGIPGELFVEFGIEMKQRALLTVDRPLVVAGYANDYIGYIVTPRAFHTGGYEQSVTRLDEHAGRTLVETAMRLVEESAK